MQAVPIRKVWKSICRRVLLRLTLNATANFVKAKYTNYITGAPPNYPAAPAGFSLAGKRIPFNPKSKFTFGARYDGSPVISDDGTQSPPDIPTVYVPTAKPGGRAPHT